MKGTGRLAPLLLVLVPALLPGQSSGTKPNPQAPFVDVTAASKISFVHQSGATPDKYMFETFGSGVAWIDYDNDGFPDLFFVNGKPGASNALYHNNKDGTFTDVTQKAGVAGNRHAKRTETGVAVGDYDNDGYLDLYVTAFGPNMLYRNNGDGTFSDVTSKAGVAGGATEWSTSTGFFDFDRDGDLDLYVANYLDYRMDDNPYCGFRKDGLPDVLQSRRCSTGWRIGCFAITGTARSLTSHGRRESPIRPAKASAWCSATTIATATPTSTSRTTWSGTSSIETTGTARSPTSPTAPAWDSICNGKAAGRNGRGLRGRRRRRLPDIFVTNFSDELNTLYQNRGNGIFEDVTTKVGLGSGYVPLGFGTKLFDFDNDGDLDIYVTNGHVIDNVQLYQPSTPTRRRICCTRTSADASGTLEPERDRRSRPSASAADWRSPTSTTTARSTS